MIKIIVSYSANAINLSLLTLLSTSLPAQAQTILSGKYINDPYCGLDCCRTIEVKNNFYRSQDSCSNFGINKNSVWRPINELYFIRKGVIRSPFKNTSQLCLESLITKTRSNKMKKGYLDREHSRCIGKGWVYNTKIAL